MSPMARRAPSRKARSAMARPMPPAPPVTRAVVPASRVTAPPSGPRRFSVPFASVPPRADFRCAFLTFPPRSATSRKRVRAANLSGEGVHAMTFARMSLRAWLAGRERQPRHLAMHERLMQDTTAPIDTKEHLADAERRLAWTRRAALLGWGLILYWQEGDIRLNFVWIVYVLGLAYMAVLHWY